MAGKSHARTSEPEVAPTKKRGRPAADPERLEVALAAVRDGAPVAEAAELAGVSTRVVYRALEAQRRRYRPPSPPSEEGTVAEATELPEIDPEGDPLTIARALLARHTDTMGKLPPDSPRLNPARAEARALIKLITGLEKDRAGQETPEQAVERKRREDGEVRLMMERYVEQYERDAVEQGICLWCGQELPPGRRYREPVGGAALVLRAFDSDNPHALDRAVDLAERLLERDERRAAV